MLNSLAIGFIEIVVIVLYIKLFYRIDSRYRKSRLEKSQLWLLVIIGQTIVVYLLSLLRLIVLSLPYNLLSFSINIFFIITITHTLFIFSFPAYIHSILGYSNKRNIPFFIFLIVNLLYMLSYNQVYSSVNHSFIRIYNYISTAINLTYGGLIIYLTLIIVFSKKTKEQKKVLYLSSGIMALHIVYLVLLEFVFNPISHSNELSIYSFFFWVSLPRDIYMMVIFYYLFYKRGGEVELTDRENEILSLLIEKRRSKEIAHTLNISLSTVNSHIYKIYKKKGVSSKRELLRLINSTSQL